MNPNSLATSHRIVLFVLAAGAASVGSAFSCSQFHEHFGIPAELKLEAEQQTGANPSAELAARERRAGIRADYQNTALVFGIAGGLLSAFIGLAAGIAARRASFSPIGFGLGLVLGAGLGCGSGLGSQFLAQQFPMGEMDELIRSMLMQVAGWMPIGLCCGLIVAIGTRAGIAKVAVLVGLSAAVASAVYPIASMVLTPDNQLTRPLPGDMVAGLLWAGIPSLVVGFSAARLGTGVSPAASESPND